MSKVKPIFKEIPFSEDITKIFEAFKDDKMPFFLDSSLQHSEIGRYSFIGSNPFLIIKGKGNKLEIIKDDSKEDYTGENIFNILKFLIDNYSFENVEGFPPFQGGAVGFFAYDLGRKINNLPDLNTDDLKVEDIYLGFYDKGVAIDLVYKKAYLFATGLPLKGEKALEKAKKDLQMLEEKIKVKKNFLKKSKNTQFFQGDLEKHFTKEEYCKVIEKTIDYIKKGEILQANITQRFAVNLLADPWCLYKALRKVNPAPFSCYLDFDSVKVCSSSPERYLKVTGDFIETRPIKGTRPRGKNPREDKLLKEELLNSEKDKSELKIIATLIENELKSVCKPNSVKIEKLFNLEEYATVYHLVSIITGKLKEEYNVVDVLKATFPGGSITGAPKVRSMEIIEELEPVKRGIYTGSVGYLGFNSKSDLNIVIRSFIIKDKKAYFQAGGGIVADSKPLDEYEEALHKLEALKISLGIKGE